MRSMAMTVALLIISALPAGAQNLFADPSFEATGVAGQARSGEKAGHLALAQPAHWVALPGALAVEPYATYQATAWVKGRVDGGAALALYAYEWDSYVWAFTAPATLTNSDEWVQVTTTLRCPYPQIEFHPLAFMDVDAAEFWIDDLTVERIASPAETIAALEAQETLSDDDARLLGRYYVDEGRMEDAWQLLESPLPHTIVSDLACVMAKATHDPTVRASLLATMIRTGAAGYNAGLERISEVSRPLSADDIGRALAAEIGIAESVQEMESITEAVRALGALGPNLTLGGRDEYLKALAAAVETRAATTTEGSGLAAALGTMGEEIAMMRQGLAALVEDLGRCTVTVDGHAVTPETYSIVVPRDATPSELHAARELQVHLERITGHVLPITPLRDALTKRRFMIGSRELDAALGAEWSARLGDEGLRISSADGHVLFDGGKRGILYAVYTFLEDYLDCRWFTADCQTWPTEGAYDLRALDVIYIPPLEYRATDYPNSCPPEFAVRNRLNGNLVIATEDWGGNITYQGFVHTFNALVPPERYFAEHPEYFSEINGQRVSDHTQLCLTNPDVLEIAIESVRRWIHEAPNATIISVSQNDWHNYCQCEECSALAAQEGSQSGPLLHFVNAIADAVAEEHPHIIIDTLAYQYTRKPPLHVTPRDNVAVRLCSIECEFNRPLDESEFNASFVDDITGWNEICDRLHIWDYVINYAHCVQPFPNLQVLQPNIRFFIENGVTGIYEEANYFSKGGELAELRTYLMAKLLWDPDYDVERGIDEFLAAYYGPAAAPIREYLDDIHRLAVSDPDFHMTIYHGPNAPFQTDEAIGRYVALFDQAEALVADDPVRLHRVRVARLPILYTQIVRAAAPGFEITEDALAPAGASDTTELIDRFMTTAEAEGLTAISEGSQHQPLSAWADQYRAGAEAVPIIRLTGGGLSAVVAPSLGGRILSLVRQEDGRELLEVVQGAIGIDAMAGGYEEYSTSDYRSPGWREPYEVVACGPSAAILRAELGNGLRLERRYDMDPGQPILRIASTVTNTTEAPVNAGLRIHPAFRLDDPSRAFLRLGPDGPATSVQMLTEQADGMLEMRFEGGSLPPGEWALVDSLGGVTIRCRFLPEQIAVCYYNGSGADRRGNLELYAPTVQLAPGESQTVEQVYEVTP
ncbi:MAG: DUF4838 domain-containing protein [Acidobacteriota bacterium]|nr:DUF4838 domain-containing protein [Acidobacteriota bacterium]